MLPTDEEISLFSVCWGIFFAVLWKFAKREGDNTSEHRVDSRRKSVGEMDYSSWLMMQRFHKDCFVYSHWIRFSSSICVSENKDSSNHSPKEVQGFFNYMNFVLFVLAPQFNQDGPYHCRWEFTGEVRKCCTRCLPILASKSQLHLYFPLCLNYTVKEWDIERDGLWKLHSVYWF